MLDHLYIILTCTVGVNMHMSPVSQIGYLHSNIMISADHKCSSGQ